MQIAWQSEIDPYACAVLRKHWPNIPNHGDIRGIRAGAVESVDVLCGGFPCQDISYAGAGAGIAGKRSGLWGEYARIIGELRPRFVIVENVAALLGRGMERVLGDLARIGYDAQWSIVSACAVGAPHVRRRVFLVAYPDSFDGWEGFWNTLARAFWEIQESDGSPRARADWRARMENPSALYGGADGVPAGMDRNRGAGNAIVPQIAEVLGRAILASDREQPVHNPARAAR